MLDSIPKRFIKGTSVTCRVACGLSSQEGWALSLTLRGPGAEEVEGVPDVDAFVFSLPQEMAAGSWWWQMFATNGAETQVPLSGELEVLPSLRDAADGFDGRSEARKALDAIGAVLAGKASTDQKSYSIKGRSLERYSVAELLQLRAFYVCRVQKEQGKSGFRRWGVSL